MQPVEGWFPPAIELDYNLARPVVIHQLCLANVACTRGKAALEPSCTYTWAACLGQAGAAWRCRSRLLNWAALKHRLLACSMPCCLHVIGHNSCQRAS